MSRRFACFARFTTVAATCAALIAPVAAAPAEAAPRPAAIVASNFTNISDHGYRVGIVTSTGTIGYDILVSPGFWAHGIGFWAPGGGVGVRVYKRDINGNWSYRFTAVNPGRYYTDGTYTIALQTLYVGG